MALSSYRLTAEEKARLDRDGFVVRERVFSAAECDRMGRDCDDLTDYLVARKRGEKSVMGSYVFQRDEELASTVKWEPDDPELVMGVEPFAHISPALNDWGLDPRLVDPCKDLTGEDDLVLFTEKVNFKRARKGGPIILHQDYPYWAPFAKVARDVVTAMIFLDAASRENGCLEVVPGTHKEGVQKTWEKYKDKGVLVFGVNCWEEDPQKAIDYKHEKKYTYALLLRGDDAAKRYGLSGIPAFFVIGKDGKVVEHISGYSPSLESQLAKAIDKPDLFDDSYLEPVTHGQILLRMLANLKLIYLRSSDYARAISAMISSRHGTVSPARR